MPLFLVNVIIENKPGIADPEGDTILNDLVLKDREISVKKVRSAKMLKFQLDAKSKDQAVKAVIKLCDEFRIFNPLVSNISVEAVTN